MIDVYGKDGCSFCEKAVSLLESHMIPYQYKKLGTDYSIEEFQALFPGVKSVPAITTYGMYIGGYDALVGYVEENSDYEQGNVARDPTQRDYNA
jgi:glutaredoxin